MLQSKIFLKPTPFARSAPKSNSHVCRSHRWHRVKNVMRTSKLGKTSHTAQTRKRTLRDNFKLPSIVCLRACNQRATRPARAEGTTNDGGGRAEHVPWIAGIGESAEGDSAVYDSSTAACHVDPFGMIRMWTVCFDRTKFDIILIWLYLDICTLR